jgi:hypothetical protein
MPATASKRAFEKNCQDINNLLDIHLRLTGPAPGRRYDVEVLHKGAIVLTTAFWEAYCEDLAAEALEHLINHAKDANTIPEALRKQVAAEMRGQSAHELAPWSLAGDGWRTVLESRLAILREKRNRNLNTPKTSNIDDLFLRAVGEASVSAAWYWSGMSRARAAEKLDEFVSLRGEVAHRGSAAATLSKNQVLAYFNHVSRLVDRTDVRINRRMRAATGRPLYKPRLPHD